MVPLYLQAPEKWARLMRTTLAFNGSYFNTNRMVKQYTRNAYYPVKTGGKRHRWKKTRSPTSTASQVPAQKAGGSN